MHCTRLSSSAQMKHQKWQTNLVPEFDKGLEIPELAYLELALFLTSSPMLAQGSIYRCCRRRGEEWSGVPFFQLRFRSSMIRPARKHCAS